MFKYVWGALLPFFIFSINLFASQFTAVTDKGETITFEVDPHESMQSFLDKLEACTIELKADQILVGSTWKGSETPMDVEFKVGRVGAKNKIVAKQPVGLPRVYEISVDIKEKKDIRFIVTTLGNNSLPSIWQQKGALEKAGDRIDHIHPLRFFMCIFTDEELKVGLHNLQGRMWVWNEFFQGMSDSFTTEKKLQNLKPEYIEDFSKTVGIDSSLIYPAINDGRWSDLVDILILNIPRNGDPDRYDM